jgi:hypothetical protein
MGGSDQSKRGVDKLSGYDANQVRLVADMIGRTNNAASVDVHCSGYPQSAVSPRDCLSLSCNCQQDFRLQPQLDLESP